MFKECQTGVCSHSSPSNNPSSTRQSQRKIWAQTGRSPLRSVRGRSELTLPCAGGPYRPFTAPSRFYGRSPLSCHSPRLQNSAMAELALCRTETPFCQEVEGQVFPVTSASAKSSKVNSVLVRNGATAASFLNSASDEYNGVDGSILAWARLLKNFAYSST